MKRALPLLIPMLALAQQPATRDDAGRNYGGKAGAKAADLMYPVTYAECLQRGLPVITRKSIYKAGWIDLNKNGVKDVYEDPAQPVEKRVEDLLARMTVDEKTTQLATLYGYNRVCQDYLPTKGWTSALWKDGIGNIDEHLNGFFYYERKELPGVEFLWPASKHTWAINEVQRFFIEETRLGIPVDMTNEGIRGVENLKATNFPTQLGLGQTWNRDLIRQVGEITGKEARALGYTNVYAPIMDVGRDQRWGRYEEVYGECPYLVSELGIPMVKAMQAQKVVSTLKHFAVYADNKGAREAYARVDPQCGWHEAQNIHLWPFERVIKGASPLGVMSSYNDYDASPVQSSAFFLQDILRRQMGFQGYVVSDSLAVEWLSEKHRTAKDPKDAVRQSIMAGLNVRTNFTPAEDYVLPLRELVKEGAVPLSVVDDRVRDVLRVKFWQGRFDAPYQELKGADAVVMAPEHLKVAKRASLESLVLLKNENRTLPLDFSRLKTIALCGPNADNRNYALGHYGPLDVPVSTVRSALEERCRKQGIRLLYTKGADHMDANWPRTEIMREAPTPAEQAEIDAAVAQAREADVAIVVVGDMTRGNPTIQGTVGENCSRTGLDLTGRQDDLIRAVAATGKPVVLVHISGRPNTLNWGERLCPAILQAFFPGMYGGEAIVETLAGDANPGGHLTVTFPRTVGQVKMNFPALSASQVESKGVSVNGLLWPFGHGLSYTTFGYTDLDIDWPGKAAGRKPAIQDTITVRCTVKNTGDRAGDDVVQLYTRDVVSSVLTYEKNLRGFERVHLAPGESRRLSFPLTPELLSLLDKDSRRVVEPGAFKVMVGNGSADAPKDAKAPLPSGIQLTGTFELLAEDRSAFTILQDLEPGQAARRGDAALKTPLVTVVEKPSPSFTGDDHDYTSYAIYYWPDPAKPDGMPYIVKDGHRNEALIAKGDAPRFSKFFTTVESLATAWAATGKAEYAARAGEWLRAWMITPKTRMNPNLEHGQIGPGHNLGSPGALIEAARMSRLVEALELLEDSAFLDAEGRRGVKAWLADYYTWITTSATGKAARARQNNHGTYALNQAAALARSLGRPDEARAMLLEARSRMDGQLEPDGSQPLELKREDGYSYSVYNLQAFFQLALQGERCGVDFWGYQTPAGASLRKALDFLTPYAGPGRKPWPGKQLRPIHGDELNFFLRIAARLWPGAGYEQRILEGVSRSGGGH